MSLLHLDDVRIRNKETFKLQEYMHYDKYDKLIQELYAKWLWSIIYYHYPTNNQYYTLIKAYNIL